MCRRFNPGPDHYTKWPYFTGNTAVFVSWRVLPGSLSDRLFWRNFCGFCAMTRCNTGPAELRPVSFLLVAYIAVTLQCHRRIGFLHETFQDRSRAMDPAEVA